jgi:XTP/dITP diphosphohydrolase
MSCFPLSITPRKEELNPDDALEATNKKFKKRFEFIEAHAKSTNQELRDMTLGEMEEIWKKAKIAKS